MRASLSSPTPLLHAQQGRPASSQPRTVVVGGTQPAAEEEATRFICERRVVCSNETGQKQKGGRGLQRRRALVVHEGEERKDSDDKASRRGERAELERNRLAASGGYDHDCEEARSGMCGA